MFTLGLDRGYNFIIIYVMLFIEENINMIVKSISLLEGEYGKPIYRYDTCT